MSVPISPNPSGYSRLSAAPGSANNVVSFQRQPQPSLTTVRPGDIPELSRYFDPKTLPGAIPKNPVPVAPFPFFNTPSKKQPATKLNSGDRPQDFSQFHYRLSFDYNERQWWNGEIKTVTNVSEHWGPVGGLVFGNSYRGYIESIDVLSAGFYPGSGQPGNVEFRWLIADWEPNEIFNIHNVKLEKIYPNGYVEPDNFQPSKFPPNTIPDAPPKLPPPVTPDQYPDHGTVPFRRKQPAPFPAPPVPSPFFPTGISQRQLAFKRLDDNTNIFWRIKAEVFSSGNPEDDLANLLVSRITEFMAIYSRGSASLSPKSGEGTIQADTPTRLLQANNKRQMVIIRTTDVAVQLYASVDDQGAPVGMLESLAPNETYEFPVEQGIYRGEIFVVSSSDTKVNYTEYSA